MFILYQAFSDIVDLLQFRCFIASSYSSPFLQLKITHVSAKNKIVYWLELRVVLRETRGKITITTSMQKHLGTIECLK